MCLGYKAKTNSFKCANLQKYHHTGCMEGLRQFFISNVKRYRKLNHLRQLDLALEIGKSANYINSIENGKYFPSPETIEKIADVLKVEPASLFQKEGSGNPLPREELVNRVYDKVIASLPDLIRSTVNSELDTSTGASIS